MKSARSKLVVSFGLVEAAVGHAQRLDTRQHGFHGIACFGIADGPGLHDDQRRDHLQIVLHAVIDLVGEYGLPIQRFPRARRCDP